MNPIESCTSSQLLLTPKRAATALSISERKLWSLTASGEIPHVRIGRCVRYPVEELRNWIASQQQGGGV
jgi:excisionase family DNA binding protein